LYFSQGVLLSENQGVLLSEGEIGVFDTFQNRNSLIIR